MTLKTWRVWLITLLVATTFILTTAFQACSGKGGSSPQNSKAGGGSGNGAGYGGKPGPGKYYWTERGHQCTERNTGKVTPVRGIMEIKKDETVTYSDGCNGDNPQVVTTDELKMSEANNQVFSYLTGTSSFEKSEDIPLVTDTIEFIHEVCYFFPGGASPGEYVDLQVVLREASPNTQEHPTQVFYSRFEPNYDLFAGLLPNSSVYSMAVV